MRISECSFSRWHQSAFGASASTWTTATRLCNKWDFGWWAFILPENMKLKLLRSWDRQRLCWWRNNQEKTSCHSSNVPPPLLGQKPGWGEAERLQHPVQPLCQNMTPDPWTRTDRSNALDEERNMTAAQPVQLIQAEGLHPFLSRWCVLNDHNRDRL